MEQNDINRRLLIALVLSFLVFYIFGELFEKPKNNTLQSANSTQTMNLKKASDPSVSTATAPKSVADQLSSKKIEPIATVKSSRFIMKFDKMARIASFELLESKYQASQGVNLQIINPNKVAPLELRFADRSLNDLSFESGYQLEGQKEISLNDDQSVTLKFTQNLNGLEVVKSVKIFSNGHYDVDIALSQDTDYFITPGDRPDADHSKYMVARGALIKDGKGIITVIEDGDAKGDEIFDGAKIASAFDRYQASMLYDFDKGLDIRVLKDKEENPLLFVAAKGSKSLHGYIGPKEYKKLVAVNQELGDTLEFGWFTFISMPFFKVLEIIYDYVGNWGWAIILFTLLVKLLLFPLSYKGMISMKKLKELAPAMKELREKYKSDPAKLNIKMMEMYKKHNANPMGGCLPMLLQIPIFFALYRVLLNAVELQGAPWILWIEDLSKMDPYYVLPILMGASMWLQQRVTPSNFTDPMQEKIFKWFPVLMTVFFVSFPAGLVLYWLINNIFTIAQQTYINAAYAKMKKS